MGAAGRTTDDHELSISRSNVVLPDYLLTVGSRFKALSS